MQGKPIIHVKMQDGMEFPNISRRQERIHLDPMSGEDRPQSYVRCGQWITSILVREGAPQSYVRRGQQTHSILVRRG